MKALNAANATSTVDLAAGDSMPLREGDIIYLAGERTVSPHACGQCSICCPALYGENSRACLCANPGTRVVAFQVARPPARSLALSLAVPESANRVCLEGR
jgi:hypothetical protein